MKLANGSLSLPAVHRPLLVGAAAEYHGILIGYDTPEVLSITSSKSRTKLSGPRPRLNDEFWNDLAHLLPVSRPLPYHHHPSSQLPSPPSPSHLPPTPPLPTSLPPLSYPFFPGLAQRSVRPEDRGLDQGLELFLGQPLGLALGLAEVGPNS